MAVTLFHLAEDRHDATDYDRALAALDEPLALGRTLSFATNREILLAEVLRLRAGLLVHLDRHSEALALLDEPMAILRRLVAATPALAPRLALGLSLAARCHAVARNVDETVATLNDLDALADEHGSDIREDADWAIRKVRGLAPDIHDAFMNQRGDLQPEMSPRSES